MASQETPSVSLRHGVRILADPGVTVEEVLLVVGDLVGHDNLVYASRMSKAVVVFLKEVRFVSQLIENGIFISDLFVPVSPLAMPSTRITISGVPPFIPSEALERELQRFGKMASGFKSIGLGCKNEKLKHVQSLRRQVFMFLTSPTQSLDVSFRVKHENGFYMVYASSGSMKCFECGDVGHKRSTCPHRHRASENVEAGGAQPLEADAGEGTSGQGEKETQPPKTSPSNANAFEKSEERVQKDQANLDATATIVDCPAPSGVGSGAVVTDLPGVALAEPRQAEQAQGAVTGSGLGKQAGGEGAVAEPPVTESQENDEMEYDSDSDGVSVTDSQLSGDAYTLEEINMFLDDTFGKSVRVEDYFPDREKFIKTVSGLQKLVGLEVLDEKKRYRLRKHVTVLRKGFEPKKGKNVKKRKITK